jgi:hypothetical protein
MPAMNDVPPPPPGWARTIADLFDEMKAGKRSHVGSPETDWARDYERSLIPNDMRFPVKGDVYEALDDVQVHYMTSWAAPVTGGGDGVLRKGDQVSVEGSGVDHTPIGVYAVAVDYGVIESRMVPEADRRSPRYGGFYFYLSTADLNRKFKLVKAG